MFFDKLVYGHLNAVVKGRIVITGCIGRRVGGGGHTNIE